MTFRAIARRYAGALFDVGHQRGTLDRLEDELRTLRDLVASNRDLKKLFESALIAPQKKRAVVDALVHLINAADGLSGEMQRLLQLLADRDRLHLVDEIAEIFEERLMAHRREVRAELTSAIPLQDAARHSLTKALSHATGGRVTLTEKVDQSMIGGVTARVGSVVFDGSVTTHLERLRQRLRQQ
jgi:F-type H+-transporting ATPase subunit delta